jgi:hypothetical protein
MVMPHGLLSALGLKRKIPGVWGQSPQGRRRFN